MKYSVVCRDDGTIVDDIVIVRREDHYFLVTNTSRKDFTGKDALRRIKEQGVEKKLTGIKLERGIPRHGYDIVGSSGEKIGVVTSGTNSPMLGVGIGLWYVKSEYALPDTKIGIVIL